MKNKISIQQLFDAGAHLGHQTKRWNPKIASYLYTSRDGVHVFNLEETVKAMEAAINRISEVHKAGGIILLVGTKNQASNWVKKFGDSLGVPYVCQRWLGGTLTNFTQVRKSSERLLETKKGLAGKEYADLTKFEILQIKRKVEKMEGYFGGLINMTKKPELMIIIDTKRERAAVEEAKRMGVETVGIVDSNCDPTTVDWPIPMNDDATGAVKYVLDLIKDELKGKTAKKSTKGVTKKKVVKKKEVKKKAK